MWDATGGKAVSYVNDHKVGVLQGTSFVLGVGAIAAAPFTAGGSLAALPTILSVSSLGMGVTAEAIDPKPGRAERVAFSLGVGLIGGSIGGALTEGGLRFLGLATDVGLLFTGLLPVGQPGSATPAGQARAARGQSSGMAGVRC